MKPSNTIAECRYDNQNAARETNGYIPFICLFTTMGITTRYGVAYFAPCTPVGAQFDGDDRCTRGMIIERLYPETVTA